MEKKNRAPQKERQEGNKDRDPETEGEKDRRRGAMVSRLAATSIASDSFQRQRGLFGEYS